MKRLSKKEIKEIKEKLLRVDSADVYDVLDSMGFPNQCLDINIRPIRDNMKVAGPAFTVLGTTEPLSEDELEFDSLHIFDLIYEDCVITINSEKDDQCGHWGEMLSYGARNKKASGVVVDGGARDKSGISMVKNWACFVRYTSPIESNKRWRYKTFEKPINMSGTLTKYVRVNPGDWIVGDCDGVIVIPLEILKEALPKIMDIYEKEEVSTKELSEGAQLKDIFDKYGRA